MILLLLRTAAVAILLVMAIYTIRHVWFAVNRLFFRHGMNYTDLAGFHLPSVSVLVPMHNEERVAADIIEALLESDYPHDPSIFEIIPIDDHSSDRTFEIVDAYARKYPCIKPYHRQGGARGKAEALKAATAMAQGEILILFDADYIPGRSLLKFLVAPFADPEVGAVMGRVVPQNVGASLLTRLLDLERAGGYQIGQQARNNLGLITQYGGTAGGVRRAALDAIGGWHANCLTEDTDLTLRLAIQGWKLAYVNRAECYEEAPATWEVRRRQIERWAIGHTDCLHEHLAPLLRSPYLSAKAKLDGVLLLCVYLTAPLVVLGWVVSVALFFKGGTFLPSLTVFFLASTCYNAVGNFASFFEIGSSVILDGARQRVLLLPLNIGNFAFSTSTVSLALAKYYSGRMLGRHLSWHKTERTRNGNGQGKGNGNGSGAGGLGAQSDAPHARGNGRGRDVVRAKPSAPDANPL